MEKEPISVKGQQVAPRDVLVALLSSVPHEELPEEDHRSAAVIDVKGFKDGVRKGIRYSLTGNMAPLTSLPAALAVKLIAKGEIQKTGVMPPEVAVPHEAILKPLGELGLVQMNETPI